MTKITDLTALTTARLTKLVANGESVNVCAILKQVEAAREALAAIEDTIKDAATGRPSAIKKAIAEGTLQLDAKSFKSTKLAAKSGLVARKVTALVNACESAADVLNNAAGASAELARRAKEQRANVGNAGYQKPPKVEAAPAAANSDNEGVAVDVAELARNVNEAAIKAYPKAKSIKLTKRGNVHTLAMVMRDGKQKVSVIMRARDGGIGVEVNAVGAGTDESSVTYKVAGGATVGRILAQVRASVRKTVFGYL